MPHMFSFGVSFQQWTDQQHRGTCRADDTRQSSAHADERDIRKRMNYQIA